MTRLHIENPPTIYQLLDLASTTYVAGAGTSIDVWLQLTRCCNHDLTQLAGPLKRDHGTTGLWVYGTIQLPPDLSDLVASGTRFSLEGCLSAPGQGRCHIQLELAPRGTTHGCVIDLDDTDLAALHDPKQGSTPPLVVHAAALESVA